MVQTQAWKKGAQVDLNIDIVRHLILNSILQAVKNHRKQYGDVIIACDTGTSWRKVAFEYYKGNRSATRDTFAIDWKSFFKFFGELIEEIKEHFPYIVINIPHAEGDDVIGTMVRWYQYNQVFEEILIISGDKDFKQLHNERTRQFSPILRKFIGTTDPVLELKQHIIKGDTGDGVPNILSPDGCLVLKERQSKVTAGRLAHYTETDPADYDPTIQRNWHRNKLMIDLGMTPQRLQDQILESFHHQKNNPTKNGVFNYLIKYRLKELQISTSEF